MCNILKLIAAHGHDSCEFKFAPRLLVPQLLCIILCVRRKTKARRKTFSSLAANPEFEKSSHEVAPLCNSLFWMIRNGPHTHVDERMIKTYSREKRHRQTPDEVDGTRNKLDFTCCCTKISPNSSSHFTTKEINDIDRWNMLHFGVIYDAWSMFPTRCIRSKVRCQQSSDIYWMSCENWRD